MVIADKFISTPQANCGSGTGTSLSFILNTYSSIYGSKPPNFCVFNLVINWSLNHERIPVSEIIDKSAPTCPAEPNLKTANLLASVKYI